MFKFYELLSRVYTKYYFEGYSQNKVITIDYKVDIFLQAFGYRR